MVGQPTMTRVRVLLEAKRLLEIGYLPQSFIPATDAVGDPVSLFDPRAVAFTLPSAVKRAVFNLTGEAFDTHRQKLYNEAYEPLCVGFKRYELALAWMKKASKEETLALIDKTLEGFEQ